MIIIEKNKDKPGFDNIIFAKKGFLGLTANNEGLIFNLFNGYYYQEQEPEGATHWGHNDLYRIAFKEYVRVLKVHGFQLQENESSIKDSKAMRLNEIDNEIINRNHNFYITRKF